MTEFLNQFLAHVDVTIITLVILSGFFQKKYFRGFTWSKDNSYDQALKTLALSFVVSLIYILLFRNPENAKPWANYFISYFFATSLYELLLQPFIKAIGLRLGDKM